MPRRRRRSPLFPAIGALLLLGIAAAAPAQVVVKVNDDVQFRLGFLLQTWADWTQDAVSDGYSANLFIRRVRFILAGNVAKNISFFYQTDSPRLGNAGSAGTKSLNTGLVTQDAFGEWKLAGDQVMIDAGLFYTPQSRGILNSSSSTLSFESPTFGQQQVTATGSSVGRDLGFQFKGCLADDRLEYRAGAFSGQRQGPSGSAAGSRNSLRAAARLQYDFFDVEKGYTYVGTNRGARKILAIGAWGDTQGDFRAYGADVIADIPVRGKDAVTAETDYLYCDGSKQFQQVSGSAVTPLLPAQRVLFAHAAYYFDAIKVQPFLRSERLAFRDDAFQTRDQQRYGAGVNWYVAGQNFKLSALYKRIVPRTRPAGAATKNTNHFAVQLQAYYF